MSTMHERLSARLHAEMSPTRIELLDQSHMHSKGTETHFNLILVSALFEGMGRLQRQRAVHAALGELMPQIHSLTMKTLTPSEWTEKGGVENPAPPCGGG